MTAYVPETLQRHIRDIERRAVETSGVPEHLAHEAALKTLRNLAGAEGLDGPQAGRRMEAYFWAIVRRRALCSRGRELHELRERFIAMTLQADMADHLGRASSTPSDQAYKRRSAARRSGSGKTILLPI